MPKIWQPKHKGDINTLLIMRAVFYFLFVFRFVSKNHRSMEHEQLGKQKALAENLFTYLDVCIANGLTNRGLGTLLNYRFRCKKSKISLNIINIKLYNLLLIGYAEKGNLTKIKEILQILKEDKIVCTTQTYAAIFECLGRIQTSPENIKLMQQYQKEAAEIVWTFSLKKNLLLHTHTFDFRALH